MVHPPDVTESSPAAAEKLVLERTRRVRSFFDQPQRYLAGNRAIPIRIRLVAKLAGEVSGDRVIDLGCGDGSLSRQFLGRAGQLTLVDTSSKMLDLARSAIPAGQSGCVRYLNVDLLEVPEEHYDLVVCVGVLAHVGSVNESLAKVARLTKPGGRCVLQLTDIGHPAGRLLHACHSARTAGRPDGYALNRLSLASILESAVPHGLVAGACRRYPFVPTAVGRLPTSWLAQFERRILDDSFVRILGSEVMVSFIKN